jgi:hypothetical protein
LGRDRTVQRRLSLGRSGSLTELQVSTSWWPTPPQARAQRVGDGGAFAQASTALHAITAPASVYFPGRCANEVSRRDPTATPHSCLQAQPGKYVKHATKTTNWREYEAGLQQRGSLTAWISEDEEVVYEVVENHTAARSPRVLIPPTRNAQLKPEAAVLRERNRNLRSRARLGRRQWHTKSGYSRRSLVENTVYRYKTIIGPAMCSRALQGQRVEARVGCRILNTMAALGMPESHRVG